MKTITIALILTTAISSVFVTSPVYSQQLTKPDKSLKVQPTKPIKPAKTQPLTGQITGEAPEFKKPLMAKKANMHGGLKVVQFAVS